MIRNQLCYTVYKEFLPKIIYDKDPLASASSTGTIGVCQLSEIFHKQQERKCQVIANCFSDCHNTHSKQPEAGDRQTDWIRPPNVLRSNFPKLTTAGTCQVMVLPLTCAHSLFPLLCPVN